MLYREHYKVESIRLPRWDYRSTGYYFVTICTKERRMNPFGYIQNERVCLSDIGTMAYQYWSNIPKHFSNVILDQFIIMPDHIHGIIQILPLNQMAIVSQSSFVETRHVASLHKIFNTFGPLSSKSLSVIIQAYKSSVTRWCRKQNKGFQWQPRFYERIIRSHTELQNVRNYILQNPRQWQLESKDSRDG